MRTRFVAAATGLAGAVLIIPGLATAALGTTTATAEPQLVRDADMHASTITIGGATVLPTTRTVAHWHGTATDPSNGKTYGYNMVGADPFSCTGSGCDSTVKVDITP